MGKTHLLKQRIFDKPNYINMQEAQLNQSDSTLKAKGWTNKTRESRNHGITVKQIEFLAKGIRQTKKELDINEKLKFTERSCIFTCQNVWSKISK